MMGNEGSMSAWFAGPKAENGEAFAGIVRRILEDYHYWRRNYFPQDGALTDGEFRRHQEAFLDTFEDRLLELLALLKADFPFYSPRYAGHMISEQSLPSIAGYFAGMLYNPNNVTFESAPVTTKLELEAAGMIARMLGYEQGFWAHLTSGGTIANIEALWLARSVKYLPLVARTMARDLGLDVCDRNASRHDLLALSPDVAIEMFEGVFAEAEREEGALAIERIIHAYRESPYNVAESGMGEVIARLDSEPALFVPESHHYCFPKALDLLGIGRRAIYRVRVDSKFRMDVADLRKQLLEAEALGKHVLAVVAVVGSTEEGAVDPVHEILDLRAERQVQGKPSFWLHVDAAYGGYLRTITLPYRLGLGEPTTTVDVGRGPTTIRLALPTGVCDALERMGECDSVVVDPHKLGYVPYPAGAVCFKNAGVKAIARQHAAYLEEAPRGPQEERGSSAIGVYVLEGSKPGASATAVWLSHKLIPLDSTGHGLLVRETVRNACELHALLTQWPTLAEPTTVQAEALTPPDCNLLCFAFRHAERTLPLRLLNELNREIYRHFTLGPGSNQDVYRQRFFVSRTTLSVRGYNPEAVAPMLERLGASRAEYETEGLFLLRSVLMNPWYSFAKKKGRYYLKELVAELYAAASSVFESAFARGSSRSDNGTPHAPRSRRTRAAKTSG